MTPAPPPAAPTPPAVRAVTVAEAARLVGLSRRKVYALVKAGRFPHLRIDGRLIVPVRAIDEWLENGGSHV